MNVIYRVHGAGGFYMETQSQDQAFRAARQEVAASGQMALVSFTWAGRMPDAPVLSGRIHGFQVVINYTNYHQKPAEIFVQITVINNLNSTGIRANIQTT